MTDEPRVTWPSAAMTTEPPRRTQTTVVERIRPSAREKPWSGLSAGVDLIRYSRIAATPEYIAGFPLAELMDAGAAASAMLEPRRVPACGSARMPGRRCVRDAGKAAASPEPARGWRN